MGSWKMVLVPVCMTEDKTDQPDLYDPLDKCTTSCVVTALCGLTDEGVGTNSLLPSAVFVYRILCHPF